MSKNLFKAITIALTLLLVALNWIIYYQSQHNLVLVCCPQLWRGTAIGNFTLGPELWQSPVVGYFTIGLTIMVGALIGRWRAVFLALDTLPLAVILAVGGDRGEFGDSYPALQDPFYYLWLFIIAAILLLGIAIGKIIRNKSSTST